MSAIRNTDEPRGAESPRAQARSGRRATELRTSSVVWRRANAQAQGGWKARLAEAKHQAKAWPTLEHGLTEDRITAAHSPFTAGAHTGWEAALLEIEHHAEHWDTPDHGETGHLIAQALRAAVEIARTGGLRCEHPGGSAAIRAPCAGPS